jgi:hypothetical protein
LFKSKKCSQFENVQKFEIFKIRRVSQFFIILKSNFYLSKNFFFWASKENHISEIERKQKHEKENPKKENIKQTGKRKNPENQRTWRKLRKLNRQLPEASQTRKNQHLIHSWASPFRETSDNEGYASARLG